MLYKILGLAVLYVAYVCRVLLYMYRGVLYVYSPPCTDSVAYAMHMPLMLADFL
jgi:hypothetical protein